MREAFELNGLSVKPGSHRLIELDIARLPSGTLIQMPVHVFHSRQQGPVVMLSGGLHGDEVNGIETVRRMVESDALRKLRAGTVLALPIINVYGFIHFSRDVPDGKDVNRSFPGNSEGSLASIVAWNITHHLLPLIDFGIDFHTGGASRTNHPQLRFAKGDELGETVARAFRAPFLLQSGLIQGSLRAAAQELGKSVVVFEGGESLRLDEYSIKTGIQGIKNVLSEYGMITPRKARGRSTFCSESHWVRAEVSGLFISRKFAGQKVKEGQILGVINSPYGEYSLKVKSPYDGHIIGHNNFPLIHRGDALFHIAQE
jgi:predicted deacylase